MQKKKVMLMETLQFFAHLELMLKHLIADHICLLEDNTIDICKDYWVAWKANKVCFDSEHIGEPPYDRMADGRVHIQLPDLRILALDYIAEW